ncbi:MAG: hypothetical protein ACI90M_000156 [Candidatus Azotimanducaceae bacterium]|jgi:hypothetical protein
MRWILLALLALLSGCTCFREASRPMQRCCTDAHHERSIGTGTGFEARVAGRHRNNRIVACR